MNVGMKQLTVKEKQLLESMYLVGTLYNDDQGYMRAISPDANGDLRFFFETLCDEPLLLKNVKEQGEHFISYDTRQYNFLANYDYFSSENREEQLRSIFKNQLVVFKPTLTFNRKNGRYFFNFDIILSETVPSISNHTRFTPVPIVQQEKDFEERLRKGKIVVLKGYNHAYKSPRYIICDNTLYVIPTENALQTYGERVDGYQCKAYDQIQKWELPAGWEEYAHGMTGGICFIESTELENWESKVVENGEFIKTKEKREQTISKILLFPQLETERTEDAQEAQFVHQVHEAALQAGLLYRKEDIVSLHTSLKTSSLSILGGMSGTGKTRLAHLYAKEMGLVEGDTLLTISVSPSFTEPSDLLGFFNHSTKQYVESETGLVSFLCEAEKHPERMHMVIFDEMNIGQVEHYFSDFISLLEMPENSRTLRLFSGEEKCKTTGIPSQLPVRSNILFVGTANFDETTKDFSNRVLDRSNVILLEKLSFSEARQYQIQAQQEQQNEPVQVTAQRFQSWHVDCGTLATLTEEQAALFDALHEQISEYDSQMGVSFRMANGILSFLHNVPRTKNGEPLMDEALAFDYQIKQRVLTKIRGHREQIQHLVGLFDDEGNYKPGILYELLNKEAHTFTISKGYIVRKAKELVRNGYTL